MIRGVAMKVASGRRTVGVGHKATVWPSTWGREAHPRHGRADRDAGGGDRAGVDAGGRGHPVHRGHADAWQGAPVLTGKLGAVMKESAQAALSWVRAHSGELGLQPNSSSDRHPHARAAGRDPQGWAVCGRAIVTALVSLLTGEKVRSDAAMTGEITLRGRCCRWAASRRRCWRRTGRGSSGW